MNETENIAICFVDLLLKKKIGCCKKKKYLPEKERERDKRRFEKENNIWNN